jgi:hypothetical protein
VRIQAENPLAEPVGRAILDDPDGRVAVFRGERERTLLKGASHACPLGFRNPSREDQRLRTPADAALQGADQHLAVPRWRHIRGTDLRLSRAPHPKSPRRTSE